MMKKEEVIFLENTKWGNKFDVKKLKKGFVKYLIYLKKVVFNNKRNFEIINKILSEEETKLKKISETTLKFQLKTNKKNTPFGSINLDKIIKELKEFNIDLESNNFLDFSPIINIGESIIKIRIGRNISNLKIIVSKIINNE